VLAEWTDDVWFATGALVTLAGLAALGLWIVNEARAAARDQATPPPNSASDQPPQP
jgi:hypothetical protein